MTDEEIVKAVRSGDYGLVPMPGDGRKFFVGHIKNMDMSDDPVGLFLMLDPDNGECEDMIGVMMGELCEDRHAVEFVHASDCARHNEPAYPAEPCDCLSDDKIPF